MRVRGENFRPCVLRVISGVVLRERLEAARSVAPPPAPAEHVCGPSTLVGWAGLPAVAVPGIQVATLVVVLSRLLGLDPWQKAVRVDDL